MKLILSKLALVLAMTLAASAQANTTAYSYQSDNGDFVGQGVAATHENMVDAYFSSGRLDGGGVFVSIQGASSVFGFWGLSFAPSVDSGTTNLAVGDYNNVTRYPFALPSSASMAVSDFARDCTQLNGNFQVLEANYNATGGVVNFAANFTQRCSGSNAALHGQVRYNSTIGLTPLQTAPVPVPAAAWLLGSGLLGLIGVCRRSIA